MYIPSSLAGLAQLTEDGGIGPAPVRAHGVTQWLRQSWPEADEDEWAYAALMAAADDSAAALTPEDIPRRLVLVAEVDDVTEEGESTGVSVDTAIALRRLDAVLADTGDVDPTSTDLGDLGWFGVQEIPDLLR